MTKPLTFAQADELLAIAKTKEEIRAVIARIDVGGGNLVSVLFSGLHDIRSGDEVRNIGSIDLANALAGASDGLRVMGETDMGRYMVTDSGSANANEVLISALERVFENEQIGRAHV